MVTNMTTKELIELLQNLDPSGEMDIFVDGLFCSCAGNELKIEIVDGSILIH